MAHVLSIEPSALLLAQASEAQRDAVERLADRRAEGVPLQHLTGRAYFRYEEVEVGPGVFIPRPETEEMVGWALG